MKHNFSLELVAFNLAQDFIQAITEVDKTSTGTLFMIDGKQIHDIYFARLGEAPNQSEVLTILQIIAHLGEDITADCATFSFAHNIFHLLELSEADKRGELKTGLN